MRPGEPRAPLWLRLVSFLVPRAHRDEWREEWASEMEALKVTRRRSSADTPGIVTFAMGALPHALWMRTEGWTVESVLQDLRYSLRGMRLNPGFTLVAALTLALGIGANASIFSLVNGLLFRPPAGIEEPDRLVQIARSYESEPRWDNFSEPAARLIARDGRAFSGVAGYALQDFVLGRGAETTQLLGEMVTGNYFEVLGVRAHLGRLLGPEDDVTPGAHPVVVLSHGLWTRRYGADPSIVGRTVPIGSLPYEVLGVAPPGFAGIQSVGSRPEIWVPTMQHPGYYGDLPFGRWGWSWINTFGRLADGVTFAQAEASMSVVSDRLREADDGNRDMEVLLAQGVGLDPEGREQARQMARLLALIVGLVLLLTCTNVANLFLARAVGRRSEIGVRLALGAGRGRVARQLVTESLALAALATLLAAPMVLSADHLLPTVFPYDLTVSVGADGRVLAFLAVVGLGAGLLFGVVPAWASVRRGVSDTLREASSTGGRSRTRLRDLLVVSQLGLSLGLVAGAAMLARSIANARQADPGFEPEGMAIASFDLQATGRYDTENGRTALERLVRAAAEQPGVESATVANSTPVVGGHSRSTVRPAGRDDVEYEAEYNIVGPDYFETLGIPIVRGRALGGLDEEPERVVVVNEALARMFWPGQDPIGQELAGETPWRVVGVAADVQMRSLRAAGRPGVYYPLAHNYSSGMVLHVRGAGESIPSFDGIRAAVASVDPEIPIAPANLHAGIVSSMSETRTIGFLVAAFAGLALTLAAVGLYGLVSYGAAQRVREMGIRLALGARPQSLVRLILARGLGIAILGIVLGIAVSVGLGQALTGLLFGVEPTDPVTLVLASAALLVTAVLAAWIPARRASRVDAAVSLRDA